MSTSSAPTNRLVRNLVQSKLVHRIARTEWRLRIARIRERQKLRLNGREHLRAGGVEQTRDRRIPKIGWRELAGGRLAGGLELLQERSCILEKQRRLMLASADEPG